MNAFHFYAGQNKRAYSFRIVTSNLSVDVVIIAAITVLSLLKSLFILKHFHAVPILSAKLDTISRGAVGARFRAIHIHFVFQMISRQSRGKFFHLGRYKKARLIQLRKTVPTGMVHPCPSPRLC